MTDQKHLGWQPKGDGWARTFETFRVEVEPTAWGIWRWQVWLSVDHGEDAEGTAETLERAMELAGQVGTLLRPCGSECPACRRFGQGLLVESGARREGA